MPGGVSGRDEGIGGVSLHIAQYLDRMIKIAQSVDQNKLASLEATLVRNSAHLITDLLTYSQG